MSSNSIKDEQLVRSYIKGKDNSLNILINRHRQRIMLFIISKVRDQSLAEDIFQETFFKVIKTLKKGKHYNEQGKFLPWVMRIAHNLVIDHFRRAKRIPITGKLKSDDDEFDIFDIICNGEKNSEHIIMEGEQHEQLRKMVQELPIEQRLVLVMRHYEELSFKDIAEKTGVSINTALGRMRYALINLRKIMEEHRVDLMIQ